MLRTIPKGLPVSLSTPSTRALHVGAKRCKAHAWDPKSSRENYTRQQDVTHRGSESSGSSSRFGLRPPEKEPWRNTDTRFDENAPRRFGDPLPEKRLIDTPEKHVSSKTKDDLQPEPVEPEPLPRDASPVIEILNLSRLIRRADLRRWCSEFGHVSDVSFPTRSPSFCRIRFDNAEDAVRAQKSLSNRPIFLGQPMIVFRPDSTLMATKYLSIQNFRGTKEALEAAVSSFENAIIHIVPVQIPGNQLRVDAFLSFVSPEQALKAKGILQDQQFSGDDRGTVVRSVDTARYYAATSPGQEGPSMAEFIDGPPRSQVPSSSRQSGPSRVLWLGNIPIELLYNKDEIIQKFSKYGPLADVRIPDEGTDKPRGYMYLEYHRQEDADACHRDLIVNPLFLFGRQVRIDYASPVGKVKANKVAELPKEQQSDRCICVSGVPMPLLRDPWSLVDRLSHYGEIVDLRLTKTDHVPNGTIFIDYMEPESAQKMLEAVRQREDVTLGPKVHVNYAVKGFLPEWKRLETEPTDTIRVWNLPSRALRDDSMLREAFGDNTGLIDLRIPAVDDFPYGMAFLQYQSTDASKVVFDWIRSDPDNPVSFFGKPIRAHYVENKMLKERVRDQAESMGVPFANLWAEKSRFGVDSPDNEQRKSELRKVAWGLKDTPSQREKTR